MELQKESKKPGAAPLPKGMLKNASLNCRREGLNYAAQCILCLDQVLVATYRGQSSRSGRQRHKEHRDALRLWSAANPLVMHCVEEHGGLRPRFVYTVGSLDSKPQYHMV